MRERPPPILHRHGQFVANRTCVVRDTKPEVAVTVITCAPGGLGGGAPPSPPLSPQPTAKAAIPSNRASIPRAVYDVLFATLLPVTRVFVDINNIVPKRVNVNGHSGASRSDDDDGTEADVVGPMAITVLAVTLPAGIVCGLKVTVLPGELPVAVNVVGFIVGLAVVVKLIVKRVCPGGEGIAIPVIAKSAPSPDKLTDSGCPAL